MMYSQVGAVGIELSITLFVGLSTGCGECKKSLQEAFNPKLLGLLGRNLQLDAGGKLWYTSTPIILWKSKLFPSDFCIVSRLPGVVSFDVSYYASLSIKLTDSEVVGIDNLSPQVYHSCSIQSALLRYSHSH